MSSIQNNAKQHIVPLLTSDRWGAISIDAVEPLAKWCVMTAMVCAGTNRPDLTEVLVTARREFAQSLEISPDWQIWIGRSPHPPDRGFSHFHEICRDGHQINGCRVPFIVDGLLIGQSFIMLIGKLIVLVVSGSQQVLNVAPLSSWGLVEIWPALDAVHNPPRVSFPTHYHPRVLRDVLRGTLSNPAAPLMWPYGSSPIHPASGLSNYRSG